MKITPLEIRQKTFEKAFRGVDKDEVQAFLLTLSQQWEKMIDENKDLKMKLEVATREVQKMREVESSLYKTLKTAEDVLRVKGPQVRGMDKPYRSQTWAKLAKTSDHFKTLIVAMFVGGMSQRDIAAALETVLEQFVLSQSSISTMTDTLSQA